MNKKEKSSITIAVIALAVLAAAVIALTKLTALPEGCDKVKDLIDGCISQSERKINACVDNSKMIFSSFNVSNCVTVNDYLSACGFNFGKASSDDCKISDVHILGVSEITDEEILEFIEKNSIYEVFQVFVAAEYIDNEEVEHNSVIKCYVISDKKSGKLLYVGSGSGMYW